MTEDRTKTDTIMDPRPSSPTEILEELVNTLRASLLPAPAPPPSASASPMVLPAVYADDPAGCCGFLLQRSLYIEMQPQKFSTERSKVAFLISLLSDRAFSQHLSACHPAEVAHQPASPANGSPVPEPMQVDMSCLSARERARRWTAGLCLYCASPDHYIQACPVKPPRPAVSTLQTDPIISKLTVLNVQLLTPVQSVVASALVDSGSSGNFISQDLID